MPGPLVIFGGTFDPPHHGHLLAAECARRQFDADRVRFIPTGQPYHKIAGSEAAFPEQVAGRRSGVSAAADRLAMLRLAVADNPGFEIDEREVHRDGPTFTIDTLDELSAERVSADGIVLLVGADTLADFWRWRAAARILEIVQIAVVPKPGTSRVPERPVPHVDVEMPPLAISSSLVRERVAKGWPVRYLVPWAVADYIETQGLYRDSPGMRG